MVRCETAKSPRQQRLSHLSNCSTAVNRMAATGSSISITQLSRDRNRCDSPGTLWLEPQGIPAPIPKVGSSAGRVFNFKS